ncbi:MAG: hypothetical protein PHS47_04345 [Methanocellales archaeon]|nr:hypothetical protein [Methanocellales archaeon]MDD4898594.1 hypothetical protein [Methanocellales archaeon]
MEHPDLLVHASIGLLTFIAIFYTLVFNITSQTKLNDLKNKIDEYLKEIVGEFEYKRIGASDEQLKKIENNLKLNIKDTKRLKFLIQLDKILYICVMLFIMSIYFFVFLNNLPMASLFFMLALTLVFHIITVWAFVFQDKYDIKSKRIDVVLDEHGQASRSFKIEE